MFADYDIFIRWGNELWQGQYNSLYPLPSVGFMAIMALFPKWLGLTLLTVGSIVILIAITKRLAPLWILYTPVLLNLGLGQIDMLCVGLLHVGSPVSLALLTLKPQLFVFALPKLWSFTLKQKLQWLGWTSLLYVPITIIRPTWIMDWVLQDDGRLSGSSATSLFSMPWFLSIAVLLIVLVLAVRFNAKVSILQLLNPLYRPYDFSFFINGSLVLIPLSWLTLWLSIELSAAWPMYMLILVYSIKDIDWSKLRVNEQTGKQTA
jgi:hypothetical protein